VAIVNDYEVVVRGVASMLEPYPDRVVVVEIAANEPVSTPVDIALYDTYAQTQLDAPAVESILASCNARSLVVYSWNLDPRLVRSALAGGAHGYLAKSLQAADLVTALERINAGETVVNEEAGPALEPGDWPGREEGLSERESEIIALITQGLTNKEIADRCYLSINTVKSYIRSGYQKMGISSRSQAVLWGLAHGFQPDHTRRTNPDEGP
jgi:NarL family two-component system response regulator LiaR